MTMGSEFIRQEEKGLPRLRTLIHEKRVSLDVAGNLYCIPEERREGAYVAGI